MATKASMSQAMVSILGALVALLIVSATPQAQPSSDVIWKQFLEWLPSAPPVESPSILYDQYRALLIKKGALPEEADRQLEIILRAHRERPDAWRVMFNNIYKSAKGGFVTEPNALLIATVEGRAPGRALDIGMGQGRNSVFLALKGWDVTGFDMSDEGIATARRNAERAGVKLNALLQNEDAFDYGTSQWDLIVFMYEPFPITSAAYVERLRRSMRPGGIIVIEGFSEAESTKNRPATAIDPGRLLTAFKDFRLLHYQDLVTRPDWGGQKPRSVVRMVAERRP
jgi:SAM-dependent methyltransferase